MTMYAVEKHIRFSRTIEKFWRCYRFQSRAEANDYASTVGLMMFMGRISPNPYTPRNALKQYPIERFRQDISQMSLD